MKPMRGTGIKLATGETIGRWSLDDHDGKSERPAPSGDDPALVPLPRGAEAENEEVEADAFADRSARTHAARTHARAIASVVPAVH